MSSVEEAKKLREELKNCGFSNRKVSVKHSYCGYSASIDVTIKDLTISIKDIQDIASTYSSIRYCEVTQEVLQGANTFVRVEYDREVLREATELKLAEAERIIESLEIQQENVGEILFMTAELNIYLIKSASYDRSLASIHFENHDGSYNERRGISCFNAYDLAEFLVMYECQLKDKENVA
ncbi:hypothetical protein [Enterococcus sp. 5H]|uniref:hypothetical protein n=1 Tax=Enterococcus sp. 5H TaxID=1229490 RepID=UPI0023035D34|nr:hypothetical protein [Enterococcus sp. 5H]MDA9469876.1 hypothetical protein [Enterococcus sp. 5H]